MIPLSRMSSQSSLPPLSIPDKGAQISGLDVQKVPPEHLSETTEAIAKLGSSLAEAHVSSPRSIALLSSRESSWGEIKEDAQDGAPIVAESKEELGNTLHNLGYDLKPAVLANLWQEVRNGECELVNVNGRVERHVSVASVHLTGWCEGEQYLLCRVEKSVNNRGTGLITIDRDVFANIAGKIKKTDLNPQKVAAQKIIDKTGFSGGELELLGVQIIPRKSGRHSLSVKYTMHRFLGTCNITREQLNQTIFATTEKEGGWIQQKVAFRWKSWRPEFTEVINGCLVLCQD